MKINPKMVTVARESRGLVHLDLAERMDISKSTAWRFENDAHALSEETIDQLSKILHYPKSFFSQSGEILPMTLSYRKRTNVSAKVISKVEANINIARLNLEALLNTMKFPSGEIPLLDAIKYGSPQNCAKVLRKLWDLEKGPIDLLSEILEKNKILLLCLDFDTERVDGMFMMVNDKVPVIVTNKQLLGDRQRFTLAYQLGHIVMHLYTSPGFERDLSHEANLFAAEFLMPKKDIIKDLEDLSLAKLGQLKKKWGVSMQAILYRASDLQLLSENQKNYLLKQFNQQNIRRREPKELDIKTEQYKRVRDLMTQFRTKQKLTIDKVAAFMHLEADDFLQRYSN